MKCIIAAIVAIGLFAGQVWTSPAAYAQRRDRDASLESRLKRQFPSATPRQIRNAAAFERGKYYEQIADAHPFGSRSWWLLKQRELGSERR